MIKYKHLREKALKFRREGMALGEICSRLSLGKSTIYHWIKDIPIERTSRQTEGQKIGTRAMQKKYEKIRKDAYRNAYENADEMLKEPLFRDFIMLYLTEGYRRTRNCVSVSNSNLCLIKLAVIWMNRLSNRDIGYAIQYHEDQNIHELKKHWADGLNIKADIINFQRKSNSGKMSGRKWRSRYGVLTVRIGDTVLRAKIQAWMDKLQEEINRV